jgi:hypothetical protein
MNYKNGYKVVYEVAAEGKRTFYAAKSNEYPTRNEAGDIIDDVVASFEDAKFLGKTIYEHKGKFYVSAGHVPAYNEDGEPDIANGEVELDFSKVLEEATPAPAAVVDETNDEEPEDEEPVVDPEEDEPEAGEDEDETEIEE